MMRFPESFPGQGETFGIVECYSMGGKLWTSHTDAIISAYSVDELKETWAMLSDAFLRDVIDCDCECQHLSTTEDSICCDCGKRV